MRVGPVDSNAFYGKDYSTKVFADLGTWPPHRRTALTIPRLLANLLTRLFGSGRRQRSGRFGPARGCTSPLKSGGPSKPRAGLRESSWRETADRVHRSSAEHLADRSVVVGQQILGNAGTAWPNRSSAIRKSRRRPTCRPRPPPNPNPSPPTAPQLTTQDARTCSPAFAVRPSGATLCSGGSASRT